MQLFIVYLILSKIYFHSRLKLHVTLNIYEILKKSLFPSKLKSTKIAKQFWEEYKLRPFLKRVLHTF